MPVSPARIDTQKLYSKILPIIRLSRLALDIAIAARVVKAGKVAFARKFPGVRSPYGQLRRDFGSKTASAAKMPDIKSMAMVIETNITIRLDLLPPNQTCAAQAYKGKRIQMKASPKEIAGIRLIKALIRQTPQNTNTARTQSCFVHDQPIERADLTKKAIAITDSQMSAGVCSIK